MTPRIITAAQAASPSGGSVYNEQIAREWHLETERVSGSWPEPTADDLQGLTGLLTSGDRTRPVLLDGLVGSAAPHALRTAAAAGVRVVLLVHLPLPAETGLTSQQSAHLAALEHRAVRAAAAVACTSHWAAADLQRRYDLPAPTVAEPGAISAPLARGSSPPLFVTPAAFTRRKNHQLLLSALGDPLLADADFTARWTGAEPAPGARRELGRQVAAAGLSDRVSVEPAVSGAELDELYARSDLVLLPSLAETYAMVLTEGFARGVPALVGADTGAAATLEGRAARCGGSHSDPATPSGTTPGAALGLQDPTVWACSLHEWLTDPDTRVRWREAARARRTELPTWSEAGRRLWRLLTEEGT